MAAAAERISYEDLYARWERGSWSAAALDFAQDRRDWQERFTPFERRAALWNYALFFWGEDAVADALAPFIDAAPLEEQKYALATQQADEARHAVFFKRFIAEVCELGDGTAAGGLEAIRPQLTWGFAQTFGLLDRVTEELRRDRSRPMLARAVTMYHLVVEASMAQPGQHMITDYLDRRDQLPAFRAGMHRIAADEQRHIALGVRLLHDLAREDPEVPAAVADMLREAVPYSTAVFVPPGWDRRYVEVFGATVEGVFEEATRSLDQKLRAAGLAAETLPGPPFVPVDLPVPERAARGIRLLEAGYLGGGEHPAATDPASVALLMDTVRRAVDHRRTPGRPMVLQWEFADAEPWHLHVENGATRVEPGREARPDLTFRCRVEDWAAVVARRAAPREQLLRGRIRPTGSPRALWAARRLFG